MLNKRAQVSDAITWSVATVIIIFILGVSIFLSSANVFLKKNVDFEKSSDLPAVKSLYAYLLTKNSDGEAIYEELGREEDFNPSNGNLAKRIFSSYSKDYLQVWLGVVGKRLFDITEPLGISNDFFGRIPPQPEGGGAWGLTPTKAVYVYVYLNEEKDFLMSLSNLK